LRLSDHLASKIGRNRVSSYGNLSVGRGPDMGRTIANCAQILTLGCLLTSASAGQQVRLVERAPDPHGSPRPARDARDVPLRTSVYLELGISGGAKTGEVSPEAVAVRLEPEGGDAIELLGPGQRFTEGVSGWIRPKQDLSGA